MTRILAAFLWAASIEAFREAFNGERPLPGDPDGLSDAQSTLWALAMGASKEI